jgi:hypothetical protein
LSGVTPQQRFLVDTQMIGSTHVKVHHIVQQAEKSEQKQAVPDTFRIHRASVERLGGLVHNGACRANAVRRQGLVNGAPVRIIQLHASAGAE